jgi:pimeloyl-ACP methyl ester carboxylesterase
MGYDYHWCTAAGDTTEYEEARKAFNAAVTERDAVDRGSPERAAAQEKVDAAYDAMRADERDYFRLNLRGGSWVADVMLELGAAFEAPHELQPPWPQPEDYGTTYDKAWDDEATDDATKKYREAHDRVLMWHGPEIPGIPVHKIAGSNDGWIVTPAEIAAALRIISTKTPEEILAAAGNARMAAIFTRWLAFLRGAMEEGDGFCTR